MRRTCNYLLSPHMNFAFEEMSFFAKAPTIQLDFSPREGDLQICRPPVVLRSCIRDDVHLRLFLFCVKEEDARCVRLQGLHPAAASVKLEQFGNQCIPAELFRIKDIDGKSELSIETWPRRMLCLVLVFFFFFFLCLYPMCHLVPPPLRRQVGSI